MSRERVRLNRAEQDSTAWQKTSAVIAARMAEHVAIATNPVRSEQERYAAAVRISELKELLKLAEPAEEKTAGAGA